jgi:hypothetical protein
MSKLTFVPSRHHLALALKSAPLAVPADPPSRGTHSEAASYEFTTLTTVPGTLNHNGARIQVLDLPGIIEGAKDGKGRGRQVIAVARTCNLIFIVLDVLKPLNDLAVLTNELEGFGIRLNKKAPNITIKKKESGGVSSAPQMSLWEFLLWRFWSVANSGPGRHHQHCPVDQNRRNRNQGGVVGVQDEQCRRVDPPARRDHRGLYRRCRGQSVGTG